MAVIEEALYTRLSTFAGLSALVGTRVYPAMAPQQPTFPLCTFQRISSMRVHAMGADVGLANPVVQVTAWGRTYTESANVAGQVRAALQDYAATVGGVEIQRIFIDNETDLGFDREGGAWGRAIDFSVWHRE